MATEFLEQQVEANIVAALAAVLTGYDVIGWWQPVAAGLVRENYPSAVLVTIRPRANAGFGSRIVTLAGTVDIRSACADDPTGEKLTAMAGPVLSKLAGWNLATATSELDTDLGVSGTFRADGFIFTDGGDADFDEQQGSWYASIPFQVKGCILS